MAITLINTPPNTVYPSETPSPHTELSPSVRNIAKHIQPDCEIYFTPPVSGVVFGKGTLYVTENQLSFFSPITQTGLAIDYPSIIIHAVSRQISRDGIGPCIYIQLAALLPHFGTFQLSSIDKATEEEENADEDSMTEIKIVPDNADVSVDTIFEALSECAALHPDQDFVEGEDNDHANGDYRELSEHGMATFAYLESITGSLPEVTNPGDLEANMVIDDERFQDADEEMQ
ncbi:3003_t:CDS:2 [Paraglomus brasilianum]|uniref:3003_t:CDS:1 n=1 Tax=Paraglomus brasilianum TaxID=144538 RepID=A0A9N9AXN4_9GLOM|nr:3003_t:CDS:2 [Paraglomus brasilianum]